MESLMKLRHRATQTHGLVPGLNTADRWTCDAYFVDLLPL